jgi:asparagine synthase (glutamine-hydrolysing)
MLDDVVAACGEPLADYSIFPTMLVSKLARQQVKVILSGDGGDELFWGYAGRFALALELTSDLDQYLEKPKARQRVDKFLALAAKLQDPRLPTTVGDFYRVKHSLSEGWLHQLLPDLPPWPADCSLFTYSGWEATPAAQWLRWNEFRGHLTRVLLKVDRASMFHSLEVRVPLLDREVIATALRIDWRSCLDVAQQIGKFPLRQALARHVHHQTWTKRGFDIPMAAWLRDPLRPVFEDLVLKRKEILGLPLNTKAAQQMFDRHLSAQAHYERELWMLLSLALWEERHYRAK